MRKHRTPEHDGQDLEPCSPNCKGCKAEQKQIDRLGKPKAINRVPRWIGHGG